MTAPTQLPATTTPSQQPATMAPSQQPVVTALPVPTTSSRASSADILLQKIKDDLANAPSIPEFPHLPPPPTAFFQYREQVSYPAGPYMLPQLWQSHEPREFSPVPVPHALRYRAQRVKGKAKSKTKARAPANPDSKGSCVDNAINLTSD
ncbi:hypothetical protein K469DRAFT_710324 [Zopfia rhizophila CBS 207.26]|uniref:Uncharacterized protein n=1 Tax=Zopfia rhizophila CBS 207.26 TaxID=1314779 RepID=A0A6A6DY28_9PEZI|nr:hypothetical protein K469DRAFT_710324 [Zopfia rhizophila CBS 207.26]